ncbi:MAG: sigma 54-interacting transcriptional regulator [Candidatus Binatia bacterium]
MNVESLQAILLAINQERSMPTVLTTIVQQLVRQRGVALARVWLTAPGDICGSCRLRPECPDQTRCLHLVASAGAPWTNRSEDWSRLDGDFRRFPLNVRKIGRIGATGDPILIVDIQQEKEWIARPQWAAQEGIQSFAGQPLIFRNDVLGVLGIFAREPLREQEFGWLRVFADHTAVAIANARAFEEIARLREQLELENAYLREEVQVALAFGDIMGHSTAIRHVLEQVQLVAPTDASVLIGGESGTGKELVARAIHDRSRRRERPLIKVNCGAVPHELFESEFFGHVKGAFTGAVRDRSGRFQLANGGTLFLDEVGEIPLELQSKLLRVLQEGEFERIGEDIERKVDVRLITATNRDLKTEVEAGRFRQDLYFRLNVFPITVPPLRDRVADIPLLADHFLGLACRRFGCPPLHLTERHVQLLQNYHWPGNVRELQNIIERAVIISRSGTLRLDLPPGHRGPGAPVKPPPRVEPRVLSNGPVVTEEERKQQERQNLVAALERAGGKLYGPGGAAELLGMKPTTLASRMKKMGLKRGKQASG